MIPIYDSYNTPDQQIDTGSGGQIILPKGDKGDPGKSAYQLAVDNGFEGTEQQWLDSLKLTLPNGTTDGQLLTWNLVSGKAEWKILENIDGGNPAVPITQSQMRRGDATAWSVANPVLKRGEWGLDTTTQRVKLGDGVTPWNALPFLQREPLVQMYNTAGSFTWTKPAGARWISGELFGGGAGGGSGARRPTNTVSLGGGGGGGGGHTVFRLPASAVPDTGTIVVGVGGLGGAANAVNNSAQTTGLIGGGSLFLNLAVAVGGSTPTSNGNPSPVFNMFPNAGAGAAVNTSGGTGLFSSGVIMHADGGASGGGITAANAESGGGFGNQQRGISPQVTGGVGGNATTPDALDANSVPTNIYHVGGPGGGGGASKASANAGNGSTGGWPGGGGGGGGASRDGFLSGKGGNGADGRVTIIVEF